MATVVLQVVGAAVGGAIGGPVGATIGRAVGAAAGYAIDQQLLSKDQVVKGGRLESSRFLASNEGTPIPKAYGRVRLGGQLIWATRFEERKTKTKSSSGGKGGSSVTSVNYKYFANFALGICEGRVSHFGRIWADGKQLDRKKITIRFYKGGNDQQPDPLIEGLQGNGRTPAYRDTAYIVFEDFPLADFGNRIPQISVEVIRSIAAIDRKIRAVTLIPGATEFGYSPTPIKTSHKGKTVSENRHTRVARSDWRASINELQALCPNLESVALVVSWFGTDLRAGECRIEPRCVHDDMSRAEWRVSGLQRDQANLVTRSDGKPAFGGTPSDESVIEAITDLKSRGLKVMFYPFVMMDIPAGNQLADPYGADSQANYPWRGRITCHPAAGQPGTVDMSQAARNQVNAFVGNASASDFSIEAGAPVYTGPQEYSYRRMILHYARLCKLAGGVERFLIGSELPGLTHIRDANNAFPFVDALVALASDVRGVLGGQTKISYAADWSEYFGYHPGNQTNDVFFNLDPLWASPDIDAVAIDNYMPISDWHDAGDPGHSEAVSRHDLDYLKSNIAGGEGADWYYESEAARIAGTRTPITDGLNEPWIWGYKALSQWWQTAHHERVNGTRSPVPTAWEPASKPVWFSEIGCPAVDRGANQPNLFIDAKSDESALPWFSSGGRDDLMQLRYLQAHLEFRDNPDHPANPLLSDQSAQMVRPEDIFVWAWDARPYPDFPLQKQVWSDGGNWYRGHWINGRLGACPLDDLVSQIFDDHDLDPPLVHADGFFEGYAIAGETTPRQALEALFAAQFLTVTEVDGRLRISGKLQSPRLVISADELVQEDNNPRLILASEDEQHLARQLTINHAVMERGFEPATTASRRLETGTDRQISMDIPAVLSRDRALSLANARLRNFWSARHSARFSLSRKFLKLDPADTVILDEGSYQVSMISDGFDRQIEAKGINRFDEAGTWMAQSFDEEAEESEGPPFALLMNLPIDQSTMNPEPKLYCAASSSPWEKPLAVLVSPASAGFTQIGTVQEPSTIAELAAPLETGPAGRWDHANHIEITSFTEDDAFQSVSAEQVFAGANAIAVERTSQENGQEWEIIQFLNAELLENGRWKLSGLLRGQLGTQGSDGIGSSTGGSAVLLDNTLTPLPVSQPQVGLPLNFRIGPIDQDFASDDYIQISAACQHVSQRPLSPVHLSARKDGDDYRFTWIRRSRINSDNWEVAEVPLDYSMERYQVQILDIAGETKRQVTAEIPGFVYLASERFSDLGSLGEAFTIRVSQLDDTGASGPETSLQITI